jgi:hypothetical protein
MKYLLTSLLVISGLLLQAQDSTLQPLNIQPGLVEFNGGMYNGNIVDFDGDADLIENAIKEKFKAQGVKPKEMKGFLVFRKVMMPAIDPNNAVDAFVKVERKSRKEKERTTVSFIATAPGQISDEKLKSGVAAPAIAAIATAGNFFKDVQPDIEKKVFDKNVADQENEVKKAEKKLKDLQDDQANMEKKIRNLQDDIEENKKNQEKQSAEVQKQKAALSNLMGKRKG